jgi:hypothetical protein
MLSEIKPLTITKRQAKELLPPKLVDRLIYAAKNFPEIEWLEILPKEEDKEVRETYIVYEKLGTSFQRIRAGEHPPDFPSDMEDRKKRQALDWPLDSRIKSGQSPLLVTKGSQAARASV